MTDPGGSSIYPPPCRAIWRGQIPVRSEPDEARGHRPGEAPSKHIAEGAAYVRGHGVWWRERCGMPQQFPRYFLREVNAVRQHHEYRWVFIDPYLIDSAANFDATPAGWLD